VARTTSQGKTMMINAIKKDINERFGGMTEDKHIWLQIASAPASGEALYRWLRPPE